MANPRAVLDFTDIGTEYVTLKYDSSIVFDATLPGNCAAIGRVVTLTGDQTVGLAADAQKIFGQLANVDKDGMCTVCFEGFILVGGGTAAALTIGAPAVGALLAGAKGYVRAGISTEPGIGFIVSAADTTKVVVYLP
jgi:hypothetical protein